MRPARIALAAALLLAACSKKAEPAPQPAPAPAPFSASAHFTVRDLGAATAVDAALARLSLAAADLQGALAAQLAAVGKGAPVEAPRDEARRLLPHVEAALRSLTTAAAAVSHPNDHVQAEATVDAGRVFVARLSDAVNGDLRKALPELFTSRDAFAAAVSRYRRSRPGEAIDSPERAGAERDFAEARAELERLEGAFGSPVRVAPRETGHELDPGSARVDGLAAAARARAAAERITSTARGPAVRYAAAQAQALDALSALAGAGEAERPAASRRYQAAKAEALQALAEYYAQLGAL